MDLRALLRDAPVFHVDEGLRPVSLQASTDVLETIDAAVRPGRRTVETGAGLSTVVFALRGAEHVLHALWMYEQERLPMTAQIVRMNRKGGPEGVIDAVEERAPDGFSSIDEVLSFEERKAIVRGYASTAGFAREQVNKAA